MSRAGGRLGLGPIDQVSYVVRSMEASLGRYEEIYGPFETMQADLPDCTIRGEQANCRLKIAINRSGPIEVELIEVLEGNTTHSEHLSAHGEGLHHVRFRVSDIDKKSPNSRRKVFRRSSTSASRPRSPSPTSKRRANSVAA